MSADQQIEALRLQAVNRLAFARKQEPELHNASNEARLDLAAAIIAMDEAEDQVPGHHNLEEQAQVNAALQRYGQALADLLRGEASS